MQKVLLLLASPAGLRAVVGRFADQDDDEDVTNYEVGEENIDRFAQVCGSGGGHVGRLIVVGRLLVLRRPCRWSSKLWLSSSELVRGSTRWPLS